VNLFETPGTLTEIEVNDHERQLLAEAMTEFIDDMESGERKEITTVMRDTLVDFDRNVPVKEPADDADLYSVDQPVTVRFDVDKEDADKVFEAERLLREAGVMFDTGLGVDGSPRIRREWHLDGIGGAGYNVVPKREEHSEDGDTS
jgi:hypothetical protein